MTPNFSADRIGFAGLGVMGSGMAHCLLRQGIRLHVFNRDAGNAQPLVAAGAVAAESPAALGRACDLVFLCLSDAAAVEDVLFGPQGLAASLAPGSCVVDTSTIAAASAREIGRRLAASSISFVDAPVSGGQQGAEQGTLGCMAGGDKQVVDGCREVMAAFCKAVTHVGGIGAGQTVKACNQVAVAGALAGVAEALALARAQGVDPALVREVLLGGTARSFALEKHGQRIIDGSFAPGFRARLMRKDLRIALQTAADAGAVLPGTARMEQLLDAMCQDGRADLDWCAVGVETPKAPL